jgi:hypothetical protein
VTQRITVHPIVIQVLHKRKDGKILRSREPCELRMLAFSEDKTSPRHDEKSQSLFLNRQQANEMRIEHPTTNKKSNH